MADPTKYAPGYSFTGFQASNPATPLPADEVDTELANIETASSEAVDAIKDIRRSDGKLKNLIVTYDSLSADVKGRLAKISDTTEEQMDAIYDFVSAALEEADYFYALPITRFGAISGVDATEELTIAASSVKVLRIPAGEWSWTGDIPAADVLWLIDPGATFPDLPTVGPLNVKNLSSLGGHILWMQNLTSGGYTGTRVGDPDPWPENYRPYSVSISEYPVVSGKGQIAIGGFSRASDCPGVNQGTIGGEFIAVNDDTVSKKPVFPAYFEAWRTDDAVGCAFAEFEAINKGLFHDLNPFTSRSLNSQETMCAVWASGGEIVGTATATAATAMWRNGAYFWRGHVVMNNSLDPTGPLEWVAMPGTYKVAWHHSVGGGLVSWLAGNTAQLIFASDTDTDGVIWNYYRRRVTGATATDSLDTVYRDNYYGWTGVANYLGAYDQVIQRTDFSGGNARFSRDIGARNSDGTQTILQINADADNAISPTNDAVVYFGTSAHRFWRSYAVQHAYTATVFDTYGAGSPEGVVTADRGSTYRRTDGGAGTCFYVKESGTGNTGWVGK